MMDRNAAWCLLTEFTQSESLRKHALAVEACMRAYGRKFAAGSASASTNDEELWGIVGLIHDFDYEEYPSLDDHPYMEKALFACDELAGFITAVALIKPGKSLAEVDTKSVRKRMKDKAFARKVNREDIINGALGLGVDLDEHIGFCIEALKGIAGELGLDGSAVKTAS